MKKTILLAFVTAVLAAGCASTGTATSTTATQPMTLEEALQKSAETRQKSPYHIHIKISFCI